MVSRQSGFEAAATGGGAPSTHHDLVLVIGRRRRPRALQVCHTLIQQGWLVESVIADGRGQPGSVVGVEGMSSRRRQGGQGHVREDTHHVHPRPERTDDEEMMTDTR